MKNFNSETLTFSSFSRKSSEVGKTQKSFYYLLSTPEYCCHKKSFQAPTLKVTGLSLQLDYKWHRPNVEGSWHSFQHYFRQPHQNPAAVYCQSQRDNDDVKNLLSLLLRMNLFPDEPNSALIVTLVLCSHLIALLIFCSARVTKWSVCLKPH